MGPTNNHTINTGDVNNSMVGHDIKKSSLKVSENAPRLRHGSSKVMPTIFLLISIVGTVALIFLSMNGVAFNETTASLIRIFIALTAMPALGTMMGSAIFKMSREKDDIPVKIAVSGHIAIFFIIIVVLTLFKVPAVTTSANTDNDSWSNGAQKVSSEVK